MITHGAENIINSSEEYPKVQIVNLEAAEQPEAFDLTPDEESDDSEADEAFVNRYLTTKSPVKGRVKP
jgi:hypothetical protein